MKIIKFLFVTLTMLTSSLFAQDKALNIDANGNITINGALNGLKIYQFNNNSLQQSTYTMKGVGTYYSTFTISNYTGCGSPGTSSLISYDIENNKIKVISQGGAGVSNRVEVSSSSPNSLNFYNDCGCTVAVTFTPTVPDITVTINTTPCPGTNALLPALFNIISQGF